MICSDHSPQDAESKTVEFDFAAFGIAGIETAFAVAVTATDNQVSMERIIDSFTVAPRRILQLNIPEIKQGSAAELTVFHPSKEWVPDVSNSRSKSANNPFWGVKLKGKQLAIVNKDQFLVID